MRKLFLGSAALLAFMGAAGAADLAPTYKAAAPVPYVRTDWSGFYVGLEAGYGWGRDSFDTNLNGARIFPGANNGLINNPFAFSGTGSSNTNGYLAGGFFGAQKQYGNWVFGIEADIDATGMTNSFRSSVTAPETVNQIVRVPEFVTTQPVVIPATAPLPVVGATVTTPVETIVINGQQITIPSQNLTVQPVTAPFTIPAFTLPAQSIVIPGQNITVTGTGAVAPVTITLPAQSFTVGGQTITIPAQQVKVLGIPIPSTFTGPTNITLPSQTVTVGGQTITIPGQTINVTASGTTAAVTITIPAQTIPAFTGSATVPGQVVTTAPQTITVAGQTITIPAHTLPVVNGTVTVPAFTIPGQTNQVFDQNGNPVLNRTLVAQTLAVTRTVTVDTKIDELASIRGRVGFTPWADVLFYGTGGIALAHANSTATVTQSTAALVLPEVGTIAATSQTSSSSASGTMLGWALGAGVDYKITPNMFVGVEYLHSDFPKNTFAFVDGRGGGFTLGNEHLKVDAVKARLGFLFN